MPRRLRSSLLALAGVAAARPRGALASDHSDNIEPQPEHPAIIRRHVQHGTGEHVGRDRPADPQRETSTNFKVEVGADGNREVLRSLARYGAVFSA